MVVPIKIGEVGRSLTCDDYDRNIDACLERSNHRGLQSCETIEKGSLELCLSQTNVIAELEATDSVLLNRLQLLESAIDGEGTVQQDIQFVRTELNRDLSSLQIKVNKNTSSINSITNRLSAIDLFIDSNNNNSSSRLIEVTNLINNNSNKIQLNTNKVNTLQTNYTTLVDIVNKEKEERKEEDNNILEIVNNINASSTSNVTLSTVNNKINLVKNELVDLINNNNTTQSLFTEVNRVDADLSKLTTRIQSAENVNKNQDEELRRIKEEIEEVKTGLRSIILVQRENTSLISAIIKEIGFNNN